MKLSRDSWLALALFALLIITFTAIGIQQSRADEIPYLSTSASRTGTLAFRLWLGELGYELSDESPGFFQPPADADIVLILSPLFQLTEPDLSSLNKWVDKGGTLILAGDNFPAIFAFQSYDFGPVYLPATSPALTAVTPLLNSPPQLQSLPVRANMYLTTERTDVVVLLAYEEKPVIVSFDQGKGRVILSTTAYPFSNAGLKEEGNGALALNLVSAAVRRHKIWFDEWHHGLQTNAIIGPGQWLRRTPAGHALLFGAVAVFLALLLRGQAFGRPVPLPHELRRRGPLEHVTAVANLNRKAGHRAAVLRQYRQQLKRHLGRRYRLDPSQPDDEYVHLLAGYNPALDQNDLRDLLARLSESKVSEGDLVTLAERASKWIRDH